MDRYCFLGADILVPKDLSSSRCPPELVLELEVLSRRGFEAGGASCEAVESRAPEAAPESWAPAGLARLPIRQAIAAFPEVEVRAFLKGRALLNWLQGALRCGECGSPLVDGEASSPDAQGRICPECGRVHFPRISPAVIVLVRREGKALLARNARFPPGRYGLIAGFVEAGETLEECAAREAREEAGIEIRDLHYRRSQPWPFPDSLMLAFTAEWAGGEARPDGTEIAELRWCGPGELPPGVPAPGSVARYLIDEFVRESAPPPESP
jgi:NAD+ diphosphatase